METVTVLTCADLPIALRAVRSVQRADNVSGCTSRIILFDDSKFAGAVDENRGSYHDEIADHHTIRVNRGRRNEFANILSAHSGINRDTVAFALLGSGLGTTTVGANRNATLLATVGETFCSMDSDVVWDIRVPPGLEELPDSNRVMDLYFSSRTDLLECLDRSSLTSMMQPAMWHASDICRAESVSAHLTKNAVALVQPAIWGDCAARDPAPLLLQAIASKRFLSEAEVYTALNSREVYRGYIGTAALRCSALPLCMTYLNNSVSLPPFMPDFRNEDGVFSVLLGMSPWKTWTHPWGVLHDPPFRRSYGDMLGAARTFRVSDVLVFCLQSYPRCEFRDVPWRFLGRYLKTIASLPVEGFTDFLDTVISRPLQVAVSRLREELMGSWCSPGLRKAGLALSDSYEDGRATLAWRTPREFSSFDSHVAIRLLRRYLYQYGELLDSWEVLRESALQLHLQGRGLWR